MEVRRELDAKLQWIKGKDGGDKRGNVSKG